MPFGALLRKPWPGEAKARWRIESQALRHAAACRVGLVLACGNDYELAQQTIACWQLQTWPDLALVLVVEPTMDAKALAESAGAIPLAIVDTMTRQVSEHLGINWVVPAAAGDLLHPSLAGVVARQAARGATAVAWDWLRAIRGGRSVRLTSRHRGPRRDCAAELLEDLR